MSALVMGATGKTGRQVVEALRARNVAVRATSRKPASPRDGVTPVVFDWRDLAAVAAITMTTGGHNGKTYLLTGPEALTFGQVAGALTEAGRSVRHVNVTPEDMSAALTEQGVPLPAVKLFDFLFEQIRNGHNEEITDTVENLTGRSRSPSPLTALLAGELKAAA